MQENPRINQQDRHKIMFPGSANPEEISQQCTPATHTQAVHCQRVLLGFPSLSLTTKGSINVHPPLEGGSPSLSLDQWRQYPVVILLLSYRFASRPLRPCGSFLWNKKRFAYFISSPLCMVILLLTTFGRVIHLSSTSSRSSLETSYFHSEDVLAI